MSPSEPELTESTANPTFINSEVVEDEFELEVEISGEVDIYDDMLSGECVTIKEESKGNRSCQYPLDLTPPETEKNEIPPSASLTTRFNCLIGNLTWWTTEDHIQGALRSVGVYDCIEIKIFENRSSGLSKGYCCCSVRSNESLKLIQDNLWKQELNGQQLQVKRDTQDSITYFEQRDISKRKSTPNDEFPEITPVRSTMGIYGGRGSFAPRSAQKFPPYRNPPLHSNQTGGFRFEPNAPAFGYRFRGHHQPPYRGHVGTWNFFNGQYRPHPPPLVPRPQHFAPPNWNEPHVPLRVQQVQLKIARPVSAPSTAEEPSSPIHAPGTSPMSAAPSPRPFTRSDPPLATSTPARPHLNPEFVRRGLIPKIPANCFIPPLLMNISEAPGGSFQERKTPGLTPEEYEDAMRKNKMVSSSAISHAVKEAASGEFEDAIETLLMAISLLRKSKVAGDERVKMLISSLQDTLEGIESKSFERSSRREQSHSRRHHDSGNRDHRSSHSHHHESSTSYSRHRHVSRYFSEKEYREERDEYMPRSSRRDKERSRSRESQDYYESKRRSSTSDRRRSSHHRDDSYSSRR